MLNIVFIGVKFEEILILFILFKKYYTPSSTLLQNKTEYIMYLCKWYLKH